MSNENEVGAQSLKVSAIQDGRAEKYGNVGSLKGKKTMDRVEYQSLIIQDLVNLQNSGELDLNPWYQRRSVWTNAQKAYLINTLFEQKPIPAIYIRHSLDLERGKSIKEIVDGQQRTRTILSYIKNQFLAYHPVLDRKVLFGDLSKEQQQRLLLTSLPVGYLLGASDSDVIDIFGRINSVSKNLNSQEKRNAAYSGEMKQFCLQQASSRVELWRSYNIFSANDIARMNETQFISDLVYNLLNGLSDYQAKSLDKMYGEYDEEFAARPQISSQLDKVFDKFASIPPDRIIDTIFTRQPIFFSLLMVLASKPEITTEQLEQALLEIDSRFNADNVVRREDIEFREACTSSTQRIAQRRTRDAYIRSFFA